MNPEAEGAERNLVTVGESVLAQASRELIDLARKNRDVKLLSIVQTLKGSKNQYGDVYRLMREAIILAFRLREKNAVFSRDEQEYLAYLLRSRMHVSGRFTLCASQ